MCQLPPLERTTNASDGSHGVVSAKTRKMLPTPIAMIDSQPMSGQYMNLSLALGSKQFADWHVGQLRTPKYSCANPVFIEW